MPPEQSTRQGLDSESAEESSLVFPSWGWWRHPLWWNYEIAIAPASDHSNEYVNVVRRVVEAARFLGDVSRYNFVIEGEGGEMKSSSSTSLETTLTASIDLSRLRSIEAEIDLHLTIPGAGTALVSRGASVWVEWRCPLGGDYHGSQTQTIGVDLSMRCAAHAPEGPRVIGGNLEVSSLNSGRLSEFFKYVSEHTRAVFVEVEDDGLQSPLGYRDATARVSERRLAVLEAWAEMAMDMSNSPKSPELLEDLLMFDLTNDELVSALSGFPKSDRLATNATSVLGVVNTVSTVVDDVELRRLASSHIGELNRLSSFLNIGEFQFAHVTPSTPVFGSDAGLPESDGEDYRLIEALADTIGQHPSAVAYRAACRTGLPILDAYLWGPIAEPSADFGAYFDLIALGFDCRAGVERTFLVQRPLVPMERLEVE